jgi:hypothetical protein
MTDVGHGDAKLRDPHTLEGEIRHVGREFASAGADKITIRPALSDLPANFGWLTPVSYLFVGFSTEQMKLLALLVSPEPLYHAFCG